MPSGLTRGSEKDSNIPDQLFFSWILPVYPYPCIISIYVLSIYLCMHACRHACIHTYIQTCMHTYIHTDIHTYSADRQTYIHIYRHTDIQPYRQTSIQTYIQTDRQIDRYKIKDVIVLAFLLPWESTSIISNQVVFRTACAEDALRRMAEVHDSGSQVTHMLTGDTVEGWIKADICGMVVHLHMCCFSDKSGQMDQRWCLQMSSVCILQVSKLCPCRIVRQTGVSKHIHTYCGFLKY